VRFRHKSRLSFRARGFKTPVETISYREPDGGGQRFSWAACPAGGDDEASWHGGSPYGLAALAGVGQEWKDEQRHTECAC
jgi:hypothetical protein